MPYYSSELSKHSSVAARRLLAVLALGLLSLSFRSLGAAEDTGDLRGDVPSGARLRAELSELAETRTTLVGDLARLEGRLNSEMEALNRLGEAEQTLAGEIERLTSSTREVAVSAFISGGPNFGIEYMVNINEPSDMVWSQYLVDNTFAPVNDNVRQLKKLMEQANGDLLGTLAILKQLTREITRTERELDVIDERESTTSDLLVIADAWDRADKAIAEGDYGFASQHKWEAMRFCESRHDYRAVSPSGRYRGAYQFDIVTWRTVGGRGDPAAADPEEQDARARELYARRGHEPWPVCGRFLR